MKRCLVIIALIMSMGLIMDGVQCGTGEFGIAGAADIKLYNGPPQGGWRPVAVTIQQNMEKGIPGLRVSIEPGGGASNVIAANDQNVLAMAMASSTYDGFLGRAPYTKKMDNIRQVMILYPQYHVIMTIADKGINSINDFKGKKINVQQRGYASELINQMILKEYNLSYKDIAPQFLGENDAVDSMKDGHIDANMASGMSPYPQLMDLMSMRKVKLLNISREALQNMAKANKGLLPDTIEVGTYPSIQEAISTVNTPTILIANKDVSDDFVYEITKTLVNTFGERQNSFAFLKKMKPEQMSADVGIPFHPGALKYFRERNWIKK
jgi:TRAP transporter TAXI family solute receptor